MSLLKTGQLQNICHSNALMTLKEYTEDYGSSETKAMGVKLIEDQVPTIPNLKVRGIVEENLVAIENGKRYFRF